jgi:hypothetical protein
VVQSMIWMVAVSGVLFGTPMSKAGRVITVTHLGDSGPGSLRAALEAGGPRVVVFAVGGELVLRRPLALERGVQSNLRGIGCAHWPG